MSDLLKKAKEATDKIKAVAGEKVDQAKGFFGDVSEVVKLEWEIAENKNTLDKLLFEYGKVCYYENVSDDEKAELKATIVEIEAAINMLETSVKKFKEEMEQKAAEKEVAKNIVFCTNCGRQFNEKENFCCKCGNKLKK